MRKFIEIIRKSINGPDGKKSSTRIAFYVMLVLIVCLTITLTVMAILGIIIPNEMLIVFGSLLTHQLALIGINKNFEAKVFQKGKEPIV